jgi:hypothetical protein
MFDLFDEQINAFEVMLFFDNTPCVLNIKHFKSIVLLKIAISQLLPFLNQRRIRRLTKRRRHDDALN